MVTSALSDTNTVTVFVTGPVDDPKLSVDPEILDVDGGPYVVITFVLQAEISGCVFPDAGAVVITSPSLQFPLVSRTDSNGLSAKLFDFNSDTKEYHYTVSVDINNLTGNTPLTLKLEIDPGIRNGD